MTLAIRLTAVALAVSLASYAAPRPDVLGVVTQARDADLGGGPVSPGATLYDGDRLSTEPTGALTLRSRTSMLYLSRETRVTLRAIPNNANATEADLSAGTLRFSASQATAIDICAEGAHIRAAANAPTVGQVSIAKPKILYVSANLGALTISYQGESGVIGAGESYRVILDPDDSSAKSDPGPVYKKPGRRRRALLLVLLAATAAATALATTWTAPRDYESPSQP